MSQEVQNKNWFEQPHVSPLGQETFPMSLVPEDLHSQGVFPHSHEPISQIYDIAIDLVN